MSCVRACDGVHRVEAHPKAGAEQRAQSFEVEQRLHDRGVIRERIDDDDLCIAEVEAAFALEVYVRVIERAVIGDLKRLFVDARGDALRRGAAVANVVLDAEVGIHPTGIVTGGEHETAERGLPADDG